MLWSMKSSCWFEYLCSFIYRYPDEVVITEISVGVATKDGTSTPAEPGDDFFSSWDKPAIKRPSNPPSRTQTPPVISRTGSPFLNPGVNGGGPIRPKSPLANAESDSSKTGASRAIPSAAIRKTTGTGASRKTNVLGAKKTQKLGAKKIGGGDALDFEAAEKKAKEEAERIEKLGYDLEAEQAATDSKIKTASITEKTKIVSPTPLSPGKAGGFGATQGHKRSDSEVERLGMGVARLGFGQIGGAKPAVSAPKRMGLGSVGASKTVEEGTTQSCQYGNCETKCAQMMMNATLVKNLAHRKGSLRTNSLAKAPLIRQRSPKRRHVCKASKEPHPSAQMRTLVDLKTTSLKQMSMAIMVI